MNEQLADSQSNSGAPKPSLLTWQNFAEHVRARGCYLLKCLPSYPDAVLVTGCQRSGTTILARVLTSSEGMVDYRFGPDDELDAALILSGEVQVTTPGRYCFQTTYLNECYDEYRQRVHDQRIIWVLRNPYSVVYSMLYNWKNFALDELFTSCGAPLLRGATRFAYRLFGLRAISPLRRACLAYNGKLNQLFELNAYFGPSHLMIVSYEDLVQWPSTVLPAIYEFIDHPYQSHYANHIHARSLNKASQLRSNERFMISSICQPIYDRACTLKKNGHT